MGESLALQISAIFILFLASFAGITLPLIVFTEILSKYLALLNALAAGVMVGLALIHLMPDADNSLSELYPDYPIANALTGFGIFLTLFLEQLVTIWWQYDLPISKSIFPSQSSHHELPTTVQEDDHNHDHDHYHHHPHQQHNLDEEWTQPSIPNYESIQPSPLPPQEEPTELEEAAGQRHHIKLTISSPPAESLSSLSLAAATTAGPSPPPPCPLHHNHDSHDHAKLPFDALQKAQSFKDLLSAYALEISTSIHSVIIGFNLGVLPSEHLDTIRVLLAVLCFHQFVEGLGLGAVIKTSQKELGWAKILTFLLVFSCTVSVGVIIGIATRPSSEGDDSQGGESDLQLGFTGAATAIAAGSLLYVALVELVAAYFQKPEVEKDSSLRLGMLGLFFLGAALMGVIGIWA